jgi:hypothetical protein
LKENSKRVRDTSLWKFTGYACGIKVNFSPCVMTGAVLANLVFRDEKAKKHIDKLQCDVIITHR